MTAIVVGYVPKAEGRAALRRAAEEAKLRGARLVVVNSARGREFDEEDSGRADAELAASGLEYTIVRPGSLTDDPGTGQVEIGERLDGGSISRDDVVVVVAAALHAPSAANRTFDVVAGETPVDQAIASL